MPEEMNKGNGECIFGSMANHFNLLNGEFNDKLEFLSKKMDRISPNIPGELKSDSNEKVKQPETFVEIMNVSLKIYEILLSKLNEINERMEKLT
ncbi:MAG: hypothetical protein WC222_11265 [Parachlamydiales bacterium]|jgi:hypothetical protein